MIKVPLWMLWVCWLPIYCKYLSDKNWLNLTLGWVGSVPVSAQIPTYGGGKRMEPGKEQGWHDFLFLLLKISFLCSRWWRT